MDVTLKTSDLITAGSSVITLCSLGWAVFERIRSTTAREQVQRFRRLLLQQEISQRFAEVPQRVRTLFEKLRKGEWDSAADSALQVTADLASLNGVQADLIGESNKEKIESALEVMREVNQRIPKPATEIAADSNKVLLESCNFVLLSVYAIESSLRFKAALGGDDDGK